MSLPALAFFALAAQQLPPLTIHAPGDPTCAPKVRARLARLPLTGETTRAAVAAAWGAGHQDGVAGEIFVYGMGNCDAQFWLSFEDAPPHRLTRALLLSGPISPQTTSLFDSLQITRRRRCGHIGRAPYHPGRQIAAAWGPPDNQVGSGIVRWVYSMADGGYAQVFPEGRGRFRVMCAPARRPRD